MGNLEQLRNFLFREVSIATNPDDVLDTYIFCNLNELTDTFLNLLIYQPQEKEIEETGKKILPALLQFSNDTIEVERLNTAIENIATGFESFLKLIAELKYGNSEPLKYKGNGVQYLGLLSTTMGKLLEGKVEKVNPRDNSIPNLLAPIVTFSYTSVNIRDKIYDNIRQLRNEVHLTPSRSMNELFKHFRDCISAYFFAIEENIAIIRPFVDPVFGYLQNLKTDYERQNNFFVNIDSEESIESSKEWADLEVLEIFENRNGGDKEIIKMPVLKAIEDNSCLWLIGEPGSGKTTSIQAYLFYEANKILNNGFLKDKKIPIIVEARLLTTSISIKEYILNSTKIDLQNFNSLIRNDNLKIFIDGINELPNEIQVNIQKEIESMLLDFEDLSLIISSRRYGFTKILDFKIFELLPLSIEQIEIYINKYISNQNKATTIFDQIVQSDGLLLDFARNPMLLKMIIQVGVRGQMQSNFGLLFKRFIEWIYEREKEKKVQFN